MTQKHQLKLNQKDLISNPDLIDHLISTECTMDSDNLQLYKRGIKIDHTQYGIIRDGDVLHIVDSGVMEKLQVKAKKCNDKYQQELRNIAQSTTLVTPYQKRSAKNFSHLDTFRPQSLYTKLNECTSISPIGANILLQQSSQGSEIDYRMLSPLPTTQYRIQRISRNQSNMWDQQDRQLFVPTRISENTYNNAFYGVTQ
eukprot:403349388